MSEQFTGPHQCIGTARAVMDLMLRNLRARCAANGGNLSSGDIEKFYSDFVSSLSSGYEMFEVQHQCCMDASASAAEQPFKREAILATLLRACGEKSAFHAFSVQIKHCGSSWTHQFFADFARYINTRMRTNVDLRLIDAYVDISAIPKIKISVNELLRHESIQSVLRECLLPLEQAESINATTKQVCDFVNQHGANARDIGMAHISKITEDQVRSFLSLLSRESKLALKSPVLGLHAISV